MADTKDLCNELRLRNTIRGIHQLPQNVQSTSEQLKHLLTVANRLGLYDAADIIQKLLTVG